MQRFVDEYAKDFNGTQAAIRAGYSKRTAADIAKENLRKPQIRAALAKVLGELTTESRLTAARVLEEIAAIAFVRPGDYVNDDGSVDFVRFARENPAAIAEIETEIVETGSGKVKVVRRRTRGKAWNKNESLRDLGRYFKLFQTDVRPKDVPKDATPAAPRAIHEYTDAELDEIIANEQAERAAAAKPKAQARKRRA